VSSDTSNSPEVSVNYTLTWEEFLEIYSHSIPRPQVTASIAFVILSIGMAAYGVLVLHSVRSYDRPYAAVFFFLCFLFLLFAAWALRILTLGRRKAFFRGLRAEYQENYCREQALAFDGERWIHTNPDGKREVSWAGVQGALETANAFAFWAKSGPVILPKRAFDGNSISDSTEKPLARGLELLRQMTLGQNEGATTCRVGFVDYELTEVASLWKTRPIAMLRYYAVGFFCSFLLAEGMRHSRGLRVIWGWAIAVLILFATITGPFWYFLVEYLSAHRDIRIPGKYAFSARGVRLSRPGFEHFAAWAAFSKFRETRRCFLLYVDRKQYNIYPKRCFSSQQQAALRKLLESRFAVNSR
jgi:YcxB-like protein